MSSERFPQDANVPLKTQGINMDKPGDADLSQGSQLLTVKSLRLHIGIFGRRNAGKSSLLNCMTRQDVSIVSPVAGTTTDPVEKTMEFLPLGPVVFIDTAGVDDQGALGQMRIEKTRKLFDRTELAIIVAAAGEWTDFEQSLVDEFSRRNTPIVVVFNKCDVAAPNAELVSRLEAVPMVRQVVETTLVPETLAASLTTVRQAILAAAPEEWINTPSLLGDMVEPNDVVVLVVPIDKEAPKGRIILPQVQTIRDLLDNACCCVVVKESQLEYALNSLKVKPKLVVTDSQAFASVSKLVPEDVQMTGFSVLFARFKGDLDAFADGAKAIETLKPGDRILIAESCSHHPIGDDIGRVKIPNLIRKRVGGDLVFDHVQGADFPAELSAYKLVIHCGACMTNRKAVLSRILHCKRQNVPITNYGMTIAFCLGLFKRALKPFEVRNEE